MCGREIFPNIYFGNITKFNSKNKNEINVLQKFQMNTQNENPKEKVNKKP